jgi:hypothetical protein
MRGKRLDQLCDDNLFYVERGKNGFLIVEDCNAAYCRTLTPVELIELGPSWSKPVPGLSGGSPLKRNHVAVCRLDDRPSLVTKRA